MQQQPAPAFAVHAEDALKAVQGALTVSAVVPHMQIRADGLRDRLTELSAIRRRMDLQSEALLVAEKDAATARGDLDKALAEKKAAETAKRRDAEREAAAIQRLVREARDLRDLARKLGRRNQGKSPIIAGSGTFARAALCPFRFGAIYRHALARQMKTVSRKKVFPSPRVPVRR